MSRIGRTAEDGHGNVFTVVDTCHDPDGLVMLVIEPKPHPGVPCQSAAYHVATPVAGRPEVALVEEFNTPTPGCRRYGCHRNPRHGHCNRCGSDLS